MQKELQNIKKELYQNAFKIDFLIIQRKKRYLKTEF